MNPPEKELEKISKSPRHLQPIALAAYLSEIFNKEGITLTVVGGALVQFYTNAEYKTDDLDAILFGDTKEKLEKVMGQLGFSRSSSYRHFEHSQMPFVVEFPPAPIEIGSRWIRDVKILKYEKFQVRVLRVEDIIMDRIIAGVEWKDRSSLDQAKLMCRKNKNQIDKKYLKDFARKEGYEAQLREVMRG